MDPDTTPATSTTSTTTRSCLEPGCRRAEHRKHPTAHVKRGDTVDDRHEKRDRSIE